MSTSAGRPRAPKRIQDLLGHAHAGLRKRAKAEAQKLRTHAKSRRERRHGQQRELDEFIAKHWAHELALYEDVMLAALDLGHDLARLRARDAEAAGKKTLFSVLITLHARACLVASEVLALIRTGHGAGAYARWRTLHEASTVAAFLTRYGEEAAVRFYRHTEIENLKTARLMHAVEPNDPMATDAMIAAMERRRAQLIEHFGKPFANDYGWAAAFVGKDKPKWRDIEDHADAQRARLHYRGASNAVHSNSVGTLLSLRMWDGELIALNTPSDDSLATPGFSSLIPLLLITSNLVACNNKDHDKVRLYALGELAHEAIDAFVARMARDDGKLP
jgi:Family of unknown function (DUF5677)